MGLRDKKAHETRMRIVSEALAMFATRGYAETTMENIADAADIHPATLYRYFPSKDLIVFADFASTTELFTEAIEATVDDVPLPALLMRAILAVVGGSESGHMERRLIRSIIDQSPAARARVWDLQAKQRARVGAVIAARTGRSTTDHDVILSARITVLIAETAADIWRDSDGRVLQVELARDLARVLEGGALVLPDPEA